MYYLHEKHCKSITIQYHVADGVSWVPRLTLLDLQTELMNALSEQISFVCRGLTVQWNSTAHHLETKAAKKGSWAAVGYPQGAWLWSPVMASRLRCSTAAGLQVSQVSWQHPQSGWSWKPQQQQPSFMNSAPKVTLIRTQVWGEFGPCKEMVFNVLCEHVTLKSIYRSERKEANQMKTGCNFTLCRHCSWCFRGFQLLKQTPVLNRWKGGGRMSNLDQFAHHQFH